MVLAVRLIVKSNRNCAECQKASNISQNCRNGILFSIYKSHTHILSQAPFMLSTPFFVTERSSHAFCCFLAYWHSVPALQGAATSLVFDCMPAWSTTTIFIFGCVQGHYYFERSTGLHRAEATPGYQQNKQGQGTCEKRK